MSSGIQQPHVPNVFDVLNPTDVSTDAGTIDPSVLSPVFPIDPTWVGTQPLWSRAGGSIAGSALTLRDDTPTGSDNWGYLVDPLLQQYYPWIQIGVHGAGTTPITVKVQLVIGVSTFNARVFTVANVSEAVTVGPFYSPPGSRMQVYFSAGSGTDSADASWMGFQADAGVPLPLIPTVTVSQ